MRHEILQTIALMGQKWKSQISTWIAIASYAYAFLPVRNGPLAAVASILVTLSVAATVVGLPVSIGVYLHVVRKKGIPADNPIGVAALVMYNVVAHVIPMFIMLAYGPKKSVVTLPEFVVFCLALACIYTPDTVRYGYPGIPMWVFYVVAPAMAIGFFKWYYDLGVKAT